MQYLKKKFILNDFCIDILHYLYCLNKNNMKKVNSINELKQLDGECSDFFILLNFGLKSSKTISFDGEFFYVFNDIDGSEVALTETELKNSIIGEAINKGSFYQY